MSSEVEKSVAHIVARVKTYAGYAIALLVLAIVLSSVWLQAFGWPIPFVRSLPPEPLAYLCGAWWLASKSV